MSGGVPPSSRAGRRQRVKHASGDVRRAAGLYQRFSGHDAEVIAEIDIPAPPRAIVAVGELEGVLYKTMRDGKVEHYIHKFAPRDRPVLCVTPNGKRIYVVGGHFTFTERGIVDTSDKSR